MKKVVLVFLLSVLFLPFNFVFGNDFMLVDTCTVNDDCANAIVIPNIVSGEPQVCIEGCNLFASPENMDNSCLIGSFPTVWYKLNVDSAADVLNIVVYSFDFLEPAISLYQTSTDCDFLHPVSVAGANLACAIGTAGFLQVVGTSLYSNVTYYVAVSSYNSIGGDFTICVSTQDQSSICVLDRNIAVVARSNPGPLEGPFDPLETVSICMNVNEYTAAGNGCQWFQGIVPVFGNGWDPSSFDSIGQPLHATINGYPFGLDGNGLYGTSTWIWTDSVGYHHDNPNLTIADLDGNGRIDICNSQYEMNCPQVGVIGGNQGPCWDENQGDLLPPGWFSYGINGTCSQPGPPIRVDWGDGNTCGVGMGPWQFCFDLVTRDVPDCMVDTTRRDLSLGFFTFADGEVGSWIGSASVCSKDHPVKLTLQAKCGRIVMGNHEDLPTLCSGDTLRYKIENPEVTEWEWNISPFWAVPYITNHGVNGFEVQAPLINNTDEPVNIKGIFIGHVKSSNDLFIQNISFVLNNAESCFVGTKEPGRSVEKKNMIRIFPMPANESAVLEWKFDLQSDATINIFNSQGIQMSSISVSSHSGYQKQLDTQSLEPGVYFVSLSNGDFRYVTKLVKM